MILDDDWYRKAVDLGDGHWLSFHCWSPDRALNPQYDGIPNVEKYGAMVVHPNLKEPGQQCISAITFDSPTARKIEKSEEYLWQVESWEPLTISPSLFCPVCGDHGFIRNGKWVKA